VRPAGTQPAFDIARVPAPVRGDNDLDARRPRGGQQLPDVLAQADRLGDFPQPR